MARRLSSVRIVALGDSLTVGFQSSGLYEVFDTATPYTDFLLANIRRDFPVDSLSVEIVNKGIVGELSEQMLARFDLDVVRLSARIVIVLGGSNDLGWGLDPKDIFRNLREMYELSVENEITPIACTVPSILGFDAGIPPRIVLNKLIQEHSRRMEIRCIDLFRATLDEATSRLASRYSSDGLHLNSEGYRVMSSAIYEKGLLPMLRAMAGRHFSSGAS